MSPAAADARLRDRYQLVTRLAVGGMGEVWRATDHVLGREVAIKVLKPALTDDPQFLERFRREARHTAALTHPGIAQVYDYAEEPGCAYLVMELVRGEPLSAVLAREGRLDVDRALDVIAQTALALQAAHDTGVVHRDVKPGNVLVTPSGDVKITDFGISRAADGTSLTQTGRVMGTAQYLSPEQAGGQSATAASDIYALGVVTYECLAGRRPFLGKNHVLLAEAHLRQQPPPLPDHIPPRVRAVVERLLAKEPAQRPRTAAKVAEELTALRYSAAANGTGGAEPQDPVTAPTATLPTTAPDAWPPTGSAHRADHRAEPRMSQPAHPVHSAHPAHAAAAPGTSSGRTSHRRARSHRSDLVRGGVPVLAILTLVVLALIAGGMWLAQSLSARGRSPGAPGATGDATPRAAGEGAAGPTTQATIEACHFRGQQYAVVRQALTAQKVGVEPDFTRGPGVPGTVSSVVPCTAQEGRTVTVTVVSAPLRDDKPGKGKGKGKK